jgi:hypothetical protein
VEAAQAEPTKEAEIIKERAGSTGVEAEPL